MIDESIEEEVWQRITSHSRYYISNFGRIKSYYRSSAGHILTPIINKKGYLVIKLYRAGRLYIRKIDRLVAYHFIKNPEKKNRVRHIDGDIINCRYNNLEWIHKEEM